MVWSFHIEGLSHRSVCVLEYRVSTKKLAFRAFFSYVSDSCLRLCVAPFFCPYKHFDEMAICNQNASSWLYDT